MAHWGETVGRSGSALEKKSWGPRWSRTAVLRWHIQVSSTPGRRRHGEITTKPRRAHLASPLVLIHDLNSSWGSGVCTSKPFSETLYVTRPCLGLLRIEPEISIRGQLVDHPLDGSTSQSKH